MRQVLLSLLMGFVLPLSAQESDFGSAQWIGAITKADANPLSRSSIILRRSFSLNKTVKHAELHICGLGFYEATINGLKVGESEFAPAWSDYDKSVFYNTYDVSSIIQHPSPSKSFWAMAFTMSKVGATIN